ncbi:MAG: glycosyltransferase family 2 protein, partial [Bacteroidota bacterium]
ICDLKVNGGKANAVRMGALYLYKKTKVETIGFLDADLSTTFKEYDSLSSEVQNYKGELKVVFGSRNLSQEGNIERNPIRKILSNIIKVLIYGITRVKIADTQCGAKVFDRELIPHIYGKTFFSRWLFDVEIILRLKKRVGKLSFLYMFLEKPLESWVHMEGSKLSFKDSILIPWNLIKIWSKYELQPARLFDLDYLSFLLNSAYSTLIRRSTTQNSIGGFLSQTR